VVTRTANGSPLARLAEFNTANHFLALYIERLRMTATLALFKYLSIE